MLAPNMNDARIARLDRQPIFVIQKIRGDRLSKHIKDKMAERGISLAYIETTIAAPHWQEADPDPLLTRSFKAIAAFGGRILRVVHRPDGDGILVVTATWDRGARR